VPAYSYPQRESTSIGSTNRRCRVNPAARTSAAMIPAYRNKTNRHICVPQQPFTYQAMTLDNAIA
jgi:hypothetical protein